MIRILLILTLALSACSDCSKAPFGRDKPAMPGKPASGAAGPPCQGGFEEKAGRCVDIDECGFVASVCGTPLAKCANKPGGYECTCPRGYAGGGPLGIACTPRVVAGRNATCALPESGGVLCWGGIKGGIWADEFPKEIDTKPTPLEGADDAVAVALGSKHGCILNRDATVACWGSSNADGQLGNTGQLGQSIPVRVERLANVRMIDSDFSHVCAVTRHGELYCWGDNSSGELGYPPSKPHPMPRKLRLEPSMVSVAVGLYHGCALRAEGTVICWGANNSGELGTGNAENVDIFHPPMAIPGLSNILVLSESAALRVDGQALFWGSDAIGLRQVNDHVLGYQVRGPTVMPSITGAVAVGGGNSWSCALGGDGQVWCRGPGPLGDGTRRDSAKAVSVRAVHSAVALSKGTLHACVVEAEGSVRCWRGNARQEIAAGQPHMILEPILVPGVELMRRRKTSNVLQIEHSDADHL